MYYVQSLVKSAKYLDASRVAASFTALATPSNLHRMKLLQANAQLEQGLLAECSATLSSCIEDDAETIIGLGIVSFRSGNHAKAMDLFKIAKQVLGDEPMLTYYTLPFVNMSWATTTRHSSWSMGLSKMTTLRIFRPRSSPATKTHQPLSSKR